MPSPLSVLNLTYSSFTLPAIRPGFCANNLNRQFLNKVEWNLHKCSNIHVSSTRCQFSIIIEPLFESYNGMVSTASMEELCRSTLSWLDQHCSLPALRPSESHASSQHRPESSISSESLDMLCVCLILLVVLRSLRLLSTTTAILTDPSLLPEQATLAVTQSDHSALLEHSLHPPTRDSIHPCDCWADSSETENSS